MEVCWYRKGAVTMNNIETLHTIYIATMTAGIIMLVITIVLFFLFDIRHVVGRLFGFSEKKEIKKLSENTAFTSQLNQKYNQKMKGKVFTESGNLKKNQTPAQMLGLSNAPGATANSEQNANYAAATQDGDDSLATAVLGKESGSNETQPLNGDQTTVLQNNDAVVRARSMRSTDLQFTITRQILLTHTDETIEI